MRRPPLPLRPLGCVAVLACALVAGCGSSQRTLSAVQLTGPESLFQAPGLLLADPPGTLDRLKRLGVDRVRVFVNWDSLAPDATAAVPPRGFNPRDPAAYPAANWGVYDEIVRAAAARGMGLDLTLAGPAPRWATARGEPHGGPAGVWKPSARDFGAFVAAVATRYDGSYRPAGSGAPLPRMDFWAIWNEPNYGVDLAPQAVDNSTVEVSPALYRGLLDAAWRALHETGHGSDTIVIGETAPRGLTTGNNPGNFSGMVPLRFIRALYCVDASYRPLSGHVAAIRGCPAEAAGRAAFAQAHPALFHATGFADHPYPQGVAPDVATVDEPDYADLATIPRLEHVLDTVQNVYGSSTRFSIYDTEFGYQTNPPETLLRAVSPTLAAYYLNWAEYLHYKDPRIRAYDQYLLVDDAGGNFATALESPTGVPKATFFAYRMPLYLPQTRGSAGTPMVVWGCARPADYVAQETGRPQHVQLQFQSGSRTPFKTIRTVTLHNPHAYFAITQAFSHSGVLRTSWRYPRGPTLYSRNVAVTIR